MKRKSSTFMRMQRVTASMSTVPSNPQDPAVELQGIIAELSPHGIAALLAQARTIRDEERRRGSRPPLTSLTLRDFTARVQEVADGAIAGVIGNRVFVAALYRLFEERGEATGCSLSEFKDRLATAHRAGSLHLERWENAGSVTDASLAKSEIKVLGGSYHFVVRKGR
jgi:hypothetical protein